MAQNAIAHKDGMLKNCVSREEYDAVVAERDMYEALCRQCEKDKVLQEAIHKDDEREKSVLRKRIEELERDKAALERTNKELQNTIAGLRTDQFGPSSEVMDEMYDDNTPLPKTHVDMLALVARMKHEAERDFGMSRDDANKEGENTTRGKDAKKRKPRAKSKHKVGVYTNDVLEALGLDTSNLPSNAKLLMRGDGPDTWVFRVLFAQRMRIYSKEYHIGRFYVPGEKDLANSAYPQGLYDKCHLAPSFLAFYFRMKISYNVSEENIVRALRACGCDIPQETLNKYIQNAEKTIREFLCDAMVNEIQSSRFTHNDETRLRVKSPNEQTGIVGYHNEYVHGILSPSARLLLLLYEDGSRGHEVQEAIMKDSHIECFVSDKAKMYPKIVTDIRNSAGKTIIRGSCWVHHRREVFKIARYDKRFNRLLKALKILFRLEAEWREEGLRERERLAKRQDLSRPVVEFIFFMLRDIVSKPKDFGEEAVKAANYVLTDEDAFKAFLNNGLIEIDNNAIERCFRHIAMGRRTWLFTGSHEAAKNLTFMYSLEESCKMNGLDFGDYIEYVMERMQAGETDARSLLPNHIVIPQDWVPEGQIDRPTQEKVA